MDKGAGGRPGFCEGCVWWGCAGRGRGRGPHRQCRPEPSRRPGALCVLPPLSPCLSLAPLSFSFSPSPPLRFEGRGIHFNATWRLLLLGLRRAGGRGVPGSLRRLVCPRQAPPAAWGFKCLFPSAPPLSRSSPGWRGWPAGPLLRDLFSPGSLKLKDTSPGRNGSRFLLLWGRSGAWGLLLLSLSLVCAGWPGARALCELAAGGCRSARPRGSVTAPASLPARPPGSWARPRTLFSFSGLFVPLSVFCHPPNRGNQTKESLYFFSGL